MTVNEFLKSLSDFLWFFGFVGTYLLVTRTTNKDKD